LHTVRVITFKDCRSLRLQIQRSMLEFSSFLAKYSVQLSTIKLISLVPLTDSFPGIHKNQIHLVIKRPSLRSSAFIIRQTMPPHQQTLLTFLSILSLSSADDLLGIHGFIRVSNRLHAHKSKNKARSAARSLNPRFPTSD